MSLIKKKNLKAKKGTQKWRKNIDVSDLVQEIETSNTQHLHQQKALDLLKKKPKFYIDVSENTALRQKLDPNRFIKKIRENKSTVEKKITKRISKHLISKKKPVQSKEKKTETQIIDPWQMSLDLKKPELNFDKIEIGTQKPHGGQSYNPSFIDHKNLINNIIETEKKKDTKIHLISNKLKPKTQTKKLVGRKLEKFVNHQFSSLKKIKKDFKSETEKIRSRKEIKKKNLDEENKKLKEGVIVKAKKLGKNKYQPTIPDFHLENELVGNLRSLKPVGNASRDAFESIIRKNKIEPGNPFGPKKGTGRIPKYKFHRKDKNASADDEKLGVTFNIYNY